jgi:hypothetical protein
VNIVREWRRGKKIRERSGIGVDEKGRGRKGGTGPKERERRSKMGMEGTNGNERGEEGRG